jgi:hypothetical protein
VLDPPSSTCVIWKGVNDSGRKDTNPANVQPRINPVSTGNPLHASRSLASLVASLPPAATRTGSFIHFTGNSAWKEKVKAEWFGIQIRTASSSSRGRSPRHPYPTSLSQLLLASLASRGWLVALAARGETSRPVPFACRGALVRGQPGKLPLGFVSYGVVDGNLRERGLARRASELGRGGSCGKLSY